MRNALVRFIAIVAPLALIGATDKPQPGEMVNNPPYANWSAFPAGTSVTQRETISVADGTTVAVDITSKLVSRTKDAVVVETTMGEVGGGGGTGEAAATKTVETFPSKVKMSQAQTPETAGTAVTEGTEALAYQGKSVDTEWVSVVTRSGDTVTEEKVWTLKDVPGGIVRRTIVKKKGDAVVSSSQLEIVEVKPGA